MEKEEKFCLKWNDYSTNLEKSFREMRTDQLLFDVTLACENTQVQAHRVVLSACSNFFKEILRSNPHSHPLLYLRGVKLSQLSSLLDFMYNGEVNMGQSDLSEFLSVAGDLEVKGLTPDSNGKESIPPGTEPGGEEEEATPASPPAKRKKVSSNLSVRHDLVPALPPPPAVQEEEPLQEAVKVERHYSYDDQGDGSEEAEAAFNESAIEDENLDYGSLGSGDDFRFDHEGTGSDLYDEHNAKVDLMVRSKMLETPEGWACSECVFSGTIRKVYQHVEMNHVSVQYFCQVCRKVCKTRNSLFCHRYRYHRNKGSGPQDENLAQPTAKSTQSFSPPNKTISNQTSSTRKAVSKPNFAPTHSLPVHTNNYILAKIENQ